MSLEIGLPNKLNALYSCCISRPWLDVVSKLDSELGIVPKYYIGWDDGSSKIQDKYNECFFQVIEDAWKGSGFPKLNYSYPLDEKLLRSISYEQNIAIKMMDRLDLDRYSFSFSDRQSFFYYLLKRWLVILEYNQINLIISPSIPHRVFDYVLYVAAKLKNIEFLMFQMTPFKDSSFIIDNVDFSPTYLKEYIKKSNSVNPLRLDIKERIELVTMNYDIAKPSYMRKQEEALKDNEIKKQVLKLIKNPLELFRNNSTYHVLKNKMPYDKKYKKISLLMKRFVNKLFLKRLSRRYQTLVTQKYNKKYIFVALHYQPEETSVPTGGLYGDQELIIHLLDSFLEKDIDIIIKEHKTQFHPKYEGATGRGSNFYEKVLNISSRVKFVSVDLAPFKLLDNAIATVTISGTIGWESVIRGTPTLIFGRAWYEDMPGVYKIKTIDDLKDNWANIIKNKNGIKKSDVLEYHKHLQFFLVDAPHYKAFVGKSKRSDEENIINIFNGIKKHLKFKNIIL